MTGKAEQVPTVVDEFVDVHSREDRGRPLLRADEIEGEQADQPAKDRPGQNLPDRNLDRGLVGAGEVGGAHWASSGSCVPVGAGCRGEGLTFGPKLSDDTGATVPELHRLPTLTESRIGRSRPCVNG